MVRNGRPLQPSLTIAQDGLDDWDVVVVGLMSRGGGYSSETLKIFGEDYPDAPWMSEVWGKFGDLDEYPVIPLLRRTEKFPLLFQKKGQSGSTLTWRTPSKTLTLSGKTRMSWKCASDTPGETTWPEPVPEFAPLPERGFIYVSTNSPLPP